MPNITQKNAGHWFIVFVLLHVTVWTVFTWLTRSELDSDSLLHFAWSQEWKLSYPHQPPLLHWIIGVYFYFLPVNELSYILLSQINIALAFVAVWYLARESLQPLNALAAVTLLEFIPYYSFLSLRLNHTSILISLWAITILVTHYCISRKNIGYWVILGFCAAAVMLAKYYSATLLAALIMVFILSSEGRKCWKIPGPYVSIGVFIAVFSVHVSYVVAEDVRTIKHISDYFHFGSLVYRWPSVKFFLAQLIYLSPALLVLHWILKRKGINLPGTLQSVIRPPGAESNILLVYLVCVVPVLITALPGFLLGADVSSRWGGPILVMSTILLVYRYSSSLDDNQLKTVVICGFAFLVIYPVLASSILATKVVQVTRNSFPGKELGNVITERWHSEFDTDLEIVGGGVVSASTIVFHSSDRPSIFLNLNLESNSWITRDSIVNKGIAVVCLDYDKLCIDSARKTFPGFAFSELEVRSRETLFVQPLTQVVYYMFVPPGSKRIELPMEGDS